MPAPRKRTADVSSRIAVRVQPRRSRDEIVGEREGGIIVRVGAAPVDGKANDAVCKLVARRAGVPRTSVSVVRGQRSRDKQLLVEGVSEAELRQALGVSRA
jgi:uncharacterized protein (TIGR00251 family)